MSELFKGMGKFAIIPHAIIKDENINSFDLSVYIVLMKGLLFDKHSIFKDLLERINNLFYWFFLFIYW